MARKWTEEQLREAVEQADSLADVLRYLGLRTAGGNHKLITQYIQRLGLQTHFTHAKQRAPLLKAPRSNEEVFLDGVQSKSRDLIRRMLQLGIEYKCVVCGNIGEHQGKSLVLQLDHQNGKHDDNRLENLRILCPNCHSQTETFAGRSKMLKR